MLLGKPLDPDILLVALFQLRGDAFDAKVVGFLVRQPLAQFAKRS
jgi:hypothetical protein